MPQLTCKMVWSFLYCSLYSHLFSFVLFYSLLFSFILFHSLFSFIIFYSLLVSLNNKNVNFKGVLVDKKKLQQV